MNHLYRELSKNSVTRQPWADSSVAISHPPELRHPKPCQLETFFPRFPQSAPFFSLCHSGTGVALSLSLSRKGENNARNHLFLPCSVERCRVFAHRSNCQD